MQYSNLKKIAVAASLITACVLPAHAQIRITEVAPWGSSGSNPAIPYLSDWFELTNIGNAAVSIIGWKMDDDSASFGSARALTGITSIAAGESVIFTENPAPLFLSTWFGGNPPAGLQIGNYTGGGVGLSQGGDAVTIFNAGGVVQAKVTFDASDAVLPLQTFDNAGQLNNTAISQLSTVGVNGAFVAVNDANEIGSPGRIAAAVAAPVGAVPEPETYAMMLAGLGVLGFSVRRRMRQAA